MSAPPEPPRTYVHWCDWLDRLLAGNDDERVLCALSLGTGDFGAGAGEHLARRVDHVFSNRLQRCHDQFARHTLHSPDLATLGRALLDFRRQLAFLFRVATIPAFPPLIQEHLTEMLDTAARTTQASLEESAQADRSGATLHCVRRHSLLTYREAPVPMNSSPQPLTPLPAPRRLRTLL